MVAQLCMIHSRVGVALLGTHTEMTLIGVRNTTVALTTNTQKKEVSRQYISHEDQKPIVVR